MLTAPQFLPAHEEATRTGQEMWKFSLSGLFQWNVTWMRPYLSTEMSSAVSLPETTAVCRPTIPGLTAVGMVRNGWRLLIAEKWQKNWSPPCWPETSAAFSMCTVEPTTRYSWFNSARGNLASLNSAPVSTPQTLVAPVQSDCATLIASSRTCA